MAWNEPGKPGQDPWGNNSNGPNKPKGQKPDPDLDELLKKLQSFLGGGGSSGGFSAKGAGVAVIVAIIVWLLSGIYTVDSPERGVVKRFGAYAEQTTAGLHWHLPWPIESVTLVNVDRIRTAEIGYRSDSRNKGSNVPSESLMLSKDENIVDIKIAVQYKVSDAKKYLYDVSDPDMTLRALTESALREVVGQNTMDFVLTEGRDEVVNKVKIITQKNLDKYETGLFITSLNLQDAQPPEQVQDAFADVVKAREDRERLINEAEAYSNDILPKARGNAARQIEDARAYHDSVIARATGQASRFDSIVAEYKKAPKVTRERLYIDAITNVLESTSKIFVGSSSSNNLLYLPLDKMIGNNAPKVPFKSADKQGGGLNTNTSSQPVKSSNPRSNIRELLRTRELR
ncbi:FtsH protease activity modulator HflK [Hydrogenovibrio kuenenii]|uniref:FtsH protease activity modulator HflK n=1 Tax=Hydrogenovibrio kuenenii TaxID=63658 RepID=UPI0004661F31|nr:FtsH protease activity modulator HflK [Hydrogenovibrio kuenenii]